MASAQSKGSPPADAPGWGSVWLEPSNEPERRWQEALRKINAAQQAHDSRAELGLCDKLVASMPSSPGPYMVRAISLGRLKQFDRAMADLAQAQKIADTEKRPVVSSNILMVRASVYEREKNYEAAIGDLQASLKLNEKNEQACNALAWLRATAPDPAARNGPESVRLAQRAIALTTKSDYAVFDTLAAAYAEANDYARAVDTEKRALNAGKEIKNATKAQKFEKDAAGRLQLFEQHQAYHADLP